MMSFWQGFSHRRPHTARAVLLVLLGEASPVPCDAFVTCLDLMITRWVFSATPPEFVPLPLTVGCETMELSIPMMEMGNVECTVAVHTADDCDEVCFLDPVFSSSQVVASNVPTCHLFLPGFPQDDQYSNYVFAIHENNAHSTCVILEPSDQAHGRAAIDVGPEGLRVTFDNGLVLSSPWAVPVDGSTALMAIGVYYYAAGMRLNAEM